MKRLKLKTQLLLGFALAAILMGMTSWTILSGMQNFEGTFQTLINSNVPRIQALQELKIAALKIENHTLDFSHLPREENHAEGSLTAEKKFEMLAWMESIENWEKRYRGFFAPWEEKPAVFLEGMKAARRDIVQSALGLIESVEQGEPRSAARQKEKSLASAQNHFNFLIDGALEKEAERLQAQKDFSMLQGRNLIWTGALLASGALLLAAGVGVYISHSASKRIMTVRNTAQEIAKGRIEQRVPISGNDEIGELAESFNLMADQLVEASQYIQGILKVMPIGLAVTDTQGAIETVNPHFSRLSAIPENEAASHNLFSLFPEKRVFQEIQREVQDKGLFQDREIHISDRHGTIIPVNLSGSLLTSSTGSSAPHRGKTKIVYVMEDIRTRKEAEYNLHQKEEILRQLLENIREVFWMVDGAREKTLFVNSAYEEIWGRPCEELFLNPLSWFNAVHPEDKPRIMDDFRGELRPNHQVEFRILRPDGSERWIRVRVFPIRNEKGEVYRIGGISEDITDFKNTERMKNEFVSTVNHELRTPLTSVRGSLGLLTAGMGGNLSTQGQQLVEIASNNCERLVRLINDLLDTEKIESGKMDFKVEPLQLGPLVRQAMEANQSYADLYKVRFISEIEIGETWVEADGDRIMQVLTNLLSNAAKYSPPGEDVVVRVENVLSQLRVAVTDRGQGIPKDFQRRIFQKFAQADSSVTRRKGGTGLGLSICKTIVEKHGGEISFETQPGQTTFFFTLPKKQEKAESKKSQNVPA